ncbi:MAG: excisionase family DNA-binding protein, partial [Pirellulales bacterium]
MAKYIELKEAAEQLGISTDELNELREQNEVRAFRDGSTWKFKSDDLETLSTKLRDRKPEEGLGLGEEDTDEGGDSILLSERELGAGVSASSTIIGKNDSGDDDDIPLAGDDPSASGSDVSLENEDDLDDLSLADSGLALADDDLDSLGKDFESGG